MPLLATLTIVLAQTTWYVDASAPLGGAGTQASPYRSIQTAIDAPATVDGDTIEVGTGTYREALTIAGKRVSIRGADPTSRPVIDPFGVANPVVAISNVATPGASLADLVVVADALGGKAALIQQSTVALSRVDWMGERVLETRGVSIIGGELSMEACLVDGFREGAGLVIAGCNAVVANSTIRRNGDFSNDQLGGGVVASGGDVLLIDSAVQGNQAWEDAGVFSASNSSDSLRIESCVISGNGDNFSSSAGGGVRGACVVVDSVISGNQAWQGGGLFGPIEALDCVIASNFGSDGTAHAVAAGGGAVLTRCVIRNNTAYGGGTESPLENVTLHDCVVVENSSSADSGSSSGGGAMRDSLAIGSTFVANTAGGNFPCGVGGALISSTAIACTFIENSIPDTPCGRGGTATSSTLTGCVIIGSSGRDGAAVSSCTLDRCTIIGTQTAGANSIIEDSTVTNSIVWDDATNLITGSSIDYSLLDLSPSAAASLGTGNITALPQFWSETAPDLRLRPSSPCIDAGDPAAFTPDGTRVDMGAYQFDTTYTPEPLGYCEPKVDQLGCVPGITATGMPSLAGTPITITATETAGGQFGLLFIGPLQANLPHYEGRLCVGGSLTRSEVVAGGGAFGSCNGQLNFPFTGADFQAVGFAVGESIFCQAFYRAGPGPLPDGLGLTAGVELVLTP